MTDSLSLPSGTNLRLLLKGCQCEDAYLFDAESTRSLIREAIALSELTVLNDIVHTFDDGGYTSAFILAESHVTLHTWPEHDRIVLVEISVCDYYRPNHERTLTLGKHIQAIFNPNSIIQEVMPMTPRIADQVNSGQGYYVELDSIIATRKSHYQEIIVADTKSFGRTLVLDGVFQTSEVDECYYHEPLVHIPMISHSNPSNVLICGGGDGIAARDVLYHPGVECCEIVDIDQELIELSKQELYMIHQGSFSDPRLTVHVEDAAKFVDQSTKKYDVIIMDTTDAVGCGEVLYSHDFYRNIKSHLNDDGCIGLHLGSPFYMHPPAKQAIGYLDELFPSIYPYMQFVPAYGTMMLFLLCFKQETELLTANQVFERIEQREIDNLQVLSHETYSAMFAIPPKMKPIFSASWLKAQESVLSGTI
jgi:spermidine synthase